MLTVTNNAAITVALKTSDGSPVTVVGAVPATVYGNKTQTELTATGTAIMLSGEKITELDC